MDANQKNQAIERLRQAQNVLITVSNDPSVDQLAATIGLALILNKLSKHTTAIFSGAIPSTIEFLQPENTLEQNAESLRDFIISLDKAKADKLRYKVEEDVVKIFITPYKTSLSQTDFNFEQGDYNVDLVIALGVDQKEHIDQAVTAHGRILHNATVLGVMAGEGSTDVGSINWIDSTASSLCEMIVSISESLQSGILDGQIATALLTGIVSCTERFSNDKTSPKVMTMAAQLMAAGANQQLISNALIPPTPITPVAPSLSDVPTALPTDIIQFDHSEPLPSPATAVLENATPANNEAIIATENPVETTVENPAMPVTEIPTAPPVEADTATQSPPIVTDQEIVPPVLLPPAPSEEEAVKPPNEIKIDEQGTLYHVGDLAEAVANAPTPARNAIISKGPDVIPPNEPEPAYGSYMNAPPSINNPMTASSTNEDLEPSIDPLSSSTDSSSNSFLVNEHHQPVVNSEPNNQVDDTNPNPTITSASTDTDGRKMVAQSMADLKASVEANNQTTEEQVALVDDSEVAARKAVLEAVNTSTESQSPANITELPNMSNNNEQSLNAGPLESSNEPPAVPPPLPVAPTVEETADQSNSTPPTDTPIPPQNNSGNGSSAPDLPLPRDS